MLKYQLKKLSNEMALMACIGLINTHLPWTLTLIGGEKQKHADSKCLEESPIRKEDNGQCSYPGISNG